jgi:ribose 5-phosphate isomerase RpiB
MGSRRIRSSMTAEELVREFFSRRFLNRHMDRVQMYQNTLDTRPSLICDILP